MDPYRVFLLLKKHFELKYPLAVADPEEFLSNEVELALTTIEQIEGEAFSPTEDGLILADELLLDTLDGSPERDLGSDDTEDYISSPDKKKVSRLRPAVLFHSFNNRFHLVKTQIVQRPASFLLVRR
ncbi:hypothetical protein L596_017475 [Steinernema carpocapsae]|uniref:Uncharacterized protein n=1 Tax=Steinernema carpocapsae TaxID=34508 RepID=A0A4U5N233_STECR|nr:hypothetical protein L596_017475 [Steinernema carpocapsae]